MQRLYSTFADRWPGIGLLVQRALLAAALVRFCVTPIDPPFSPFSMIPRIVGGCAATLILIGLWTPVAGTIIAMLETSLAATHIGDPWISIILATIGGTLAILGPGAFSVDARLFGRRHLKL